MAAKGGEWYPAEPYVGAQLRVKRGFYYHHGICTGEDAVVHYCGESGGELGGADTLVRETTLEAFAGDGSVEVRLYTLRERLALRKPAAAAAAARARVGEGGYDLLHHNCEDFSNECAFGEKREGQMDEYRRQVRELLEKDKKTE